MSLQSAWSIALVAASLLAVLPAAVFFAEIVAGSSLNRRVAKSPLRSTRPRLAVVMPAHDEASGIAPAILAVMQQLEAGDRLLVVADNCQDETAGIARALGAEVVERADLLQRGKGFALDFGIRALVASPPEVVVIVDADCEIAPGALAALADQCGLTNRPAQALYLMHAPAGARLSMRIAEFAWLIKNKMRPMGAAAMGWPCQLMGTGMAFRWDAIQRASLASGHLVEDMQLGIDMARAGLAPLFCPEAMVKSAFPMDREAARSQRTRWEHGHLSTLAAGPRLIWSALRRGDMALLTLALDLMVPPLAALGVMLVAWAMATGVSWWLGSSALPFWLSACAVAMLTGGVIIAWRREGRRIVSPGELLMLPIYVTAKMPVYVRWLAKRQTEWVRTKRDEPRH